MRDGAALRSSTMVALINHHVGSLKHTLSSLQALVNFLHSLAGILKEGLRSVVSPGVKDQAGSQDNLGGHLLGAKFVHQIILVLTLELLKAII